MDEIKERRLDLKSELAEFKEILYTHIEHFKIHEASEEKKYEEILRVQHDINEKMKGLLEAWEITINTFKALSLLGSAMKWITGVVIGLGSVWALYSGNMPLGK